jgi:hypothetical protein
MRTLSILLCSLLLLAPAEGQQAVKRTTPSFYVPYGVRDVQPAPLDEYSSSDAQFDQPYDIAYASPSPQMQRRYPPMRRPGLHPYRSRYGMQQSQPEFSTAEAFVTLGLITVFVVAYAIGNH